MIIDTMGLTASHLADGVGNFVHIPYRIANQGLFLFSKEADVALVVLPVTSIEDPTFLRWLGLRGIYSVEDINGSFARIGEGRVIERLRRHRKAPLLLPGRVVAAFGLSREWPYVARRYLEARLASSWVAGGNSLVTRTFNWTILNNNPSLRAELDGRHDALCEMIRTTERILDNDADEFTEVPSGTRFFRDVLRTERAEEDAPDESGWTEVRIEQQRAVAHARTFPPGSRLRFEDGLIRALAVVRRDAVVLEPGSTVYTSTGQQAGRNFRKTHSRFLAAAQVEQECEVGITRVAVTADSAAFLIKAATGGRVHVASRWQIV
ncbi:hypothetical protein DevBK_20310 [Devosia sp. BK]|uniref:hypothetical protein n=1 Tax=Devosia sp. BK TaxID=2871706 RepID=UPI00293B7A1B|nr:hypothetical protein [Devosia sp. BK]MDV3253690.1 hypothetical protein [Devosia sp. BK]